MTNTTKPAYCCHQTRLTALADARWAALHAGSAADLAGIVDSLIHQTKEQQMTNQPFEASNGSSLHLDGFGNLCIDEDVALEKGDLEPVREFFQHERDQQLGRARWPENPDYVIYRDPGSDGRDGRRVRVLYEPDGFSVSFWETLVTVSLRKFERAAYWYVKEILGKPERPWEQAQAGEVWRLTVDGKDGTFLVRGTDSGTPFFCGQKIAYLGADHTHITAGRKLLNADGTPADE